MRHDAVAWGYARAADRLGVDIIENCEVTGFVIEDGHGHRRRDHARPHPAGTHGHRGRRPHLACRGDGRPRLPVESHLLQAFVTEPIKPFVDHVISFGAELFYLSQSDKGGLVFGGHIDGFNTYTQRGQFPKVQTVAECAVVADALRLAPAAAAPLGRHPGHDARRQPVHLPHAGPQSLSQRRLVLSGLQGDAGLRLVLRPHHRP